MKKILSLIFAVSFMVFGFSQTKHQQFITKVGKAVKVITNRPAQSKSNLAKGIFLFETFNNGLPADWTITDGGNDGKTWEVVESYDGSTIDGSPFAMVNSDAAGYVDMDEILETPEIDLSSADSVYLELDQVFNSYSGNEIGDIDVWDGSQWVNVFRNTTDSGSWSEPLHISLNVTNYKNANFKVRFHYYNANYDWYWAIDNVVIYQPDPVDLSALSVSANPSYHLIDLLRPVTFTVNVFNIGMDSITQYEAGLLVINSAGDTVFTVRDTVVTNLAHGGKENHIFSQTWTPGELDTFTVKAFVITEDDAVSDNDTVETHVYVIDRQNYYSFIYGFVAYDKDTTGDLNRIVGINPSTGDYIRVYDSLALTDIFNTGDYVNINGYNYLLGLTFDNNLYIIGDHGQAYNLGALPMVDTPALLVTPTGMTWNNKNNTIYITYYVIVNFTTAYTKLYKLNLNDFSLDEVGQVNSTEAVIGLVSDTNGVLYSLDFADTLATIDTADATFNVIGDIGIDIGYIQDIGIDRPTNTIYGTLYNTSPARGELYIINTDASMQFIDSLLDEITLCAISSDGIQAHAAQLNKPNIKIYPNPASRVIHVTNAQGYNLQILDLTGRVIVSQPIISNMQSVALPSLSSGLYLVTLKGKQGQFTYKLIVR